jgi:hypothetical protein
MAPPNVKTVLDREIATLEAKIAALRAAREALVGSPAARFSATKTSGKRVGRRPGYKVSAATKAKLRAAWKRRKAAQANS